MALFSEASSLFGTNYIPDSHRIVDPFKSGEETSRLFIRFLKMEKLIRNRSHLAIVLNANWQPRSHFRNIVCTRKSEIRKQIGTRACVWLYYFFAWSVCIFFGVTFQNIVNINIIVSVILITRSKHIVSIIILIRETMSSQNHSRQLHSSWSISGSNEQLILQSNSCTFTATLKRFY